MSTLAKPAPEINDLAALVLCDLALSPEDERSHQRIDGLVGCIHSISAESIPSFITALENAHLIELRRIRSRDNQRQTSWRVRITDAGLRHYHAFIQSLRTTTAHA